MNLLVLQELRVKDEELEKQVAELKSKLEELEQLAKARGLTGIFQLRQQPATTGSEKPTKSSWIIIIIIIITKTEPKLTIR